MAGTYKRYVRLHSPPWLFAVVASVYWLLNPYTDTQLLYPTGNCYRHWNLTTGEKYHFPDLRHIRKASVDRRDKYDTYTIDEFAAVEPGDTVVEIGAYVGEFTLPASNIAEHVVAFEPAPQSFESLRLNTADLANVEVYQRAISDSDGTVSFNVAPDPSDNSLLAVDSGERTERLQVKSMRLPTAMDAVGVSQIDFLKIDAEGAEPEVVAGIGDFPVDRIAVDCSAERDAESPVEEIRATLGRRGFETRLRTDPRPILCGRRT
ncbi:FkbM family methyltransferase [Haloarcula sp. JP-L23]|uniref:FkbM family methyltransferase n=1 Tax=Haloarcula sp. JP-L23 TaxID=2716717 RepID=UPI00140F2E71|nr:FkbM family methyltransferase [Haloarcula sp. JP-L23]